MKNKIQKKEIVCILIIIVLALGTRMSYFLDYKNGPAYPVLEASDSQAYYTWARDIESGQLLPSKAFMKWPFYAYFLGFIFKCFGTNLEAVYTFQFILGIINCLLLFYITRKIFGLQTGFIASLLYCFYGLFIFFESLLVYTSLSLCFNLLFFLYLLYLREPFKKTDFIYLGLLLGLCTITQANVLVFGILALTWILFRAKLPNKVKIFRFLLFFGFLLLIVSSAAITNYLVEDDFILIAGHLGINFYIGNNPEATGLFYNLKGMGHSQEGMFRDAAIRAEYHKGKELKTSEVSKYWLKEAFNFVRDDPGQYFGLMAKKLNFVLSPDEYIHDMEFSLIKNRIGVFRFLFLNLSFIMPFALLGLFLGLKALKKNMLLYLALAVFLFSITIFFVDSRYRIMAVPFLIIFAAYSLHCIWQAAKLRNYRQLFFLGLMAVVLCLGLQYNPHNKPKPASVFEHYFYEAFELEVNKKYLEAVLALKAADQIKPQDEDVLFRLGVLYYRLGEFEQSKENFKRVTDLNHLNVDAYYNLGFLNNIEENYPEAVIALEKAVNFDPENPKSNYELGLAYKGIGDTQKAVKAFKIALKKISSWRKYDKSLIIDQLANIAK